MRRNGDQEEGCEEDVEEEVAAFFGGSFVDSRTPPGEGF
jgi:hypothetical protein